jgi:hypothetical protein
MAFMAENIYSIRPIKMIDGHFQNRTVELPNSDVDANSLLSSLHLEVPSFEFARYIQVDSSISDPYIVCKVHFRKVDCRRLPRGLRFKIPHDHEIGLTPDMRRSG